MITMPVFKFKAQLFFLNQQLGGRKAPANSGYRPHLKIDNVIHTSCVLNTTNHEPMKPGYYYTVEAILPFTQQVESCLDMPLVDYLPVGKQIQLFEGSRIIAIGIILEIY